MTVTRASSEPANIERQATESHADQDRSERWRDYSVAYGNESGPIASLSHGTSHGLGQFAVYGQAGWSLHGLSRG
jgi:hypothetical protein